MFSRRGGLQLARLAASQRVQQSTASRLKSILRPNDVTHETDSYGIPAHPTWSVNDLLSSYPQPTIPPSTLKRLHELSALIPPEEGTLAHAKLTQGLEGLVRLVEAVKLVDTSEVEIWAEGKGIKLDAAMDTPDDSVSGQALLKHSSRTRDGFYVVDADKRRI
ncbi:hypothetical protein CERSUDRAFT_43945 [Gelatoporia subvermispora B]|uniref:Glutamyl-tRNA(Gln) amidotransferase subunit F, mitochondrial n=1 Tax=Ceriporiopsis subvermispora (strain B) TaxID=914234 RepID=M2PUN8_CERS8|nr:hypothetical protein CERSUDRAFT_43945 [Gelatoporia subvermispora B]